MTNSLLRIKVDRSTLADVVDKLAELGPAIETKSFRAGGRKAARLLQKAIETRTPRGKKPPKFAGKPHLKDNVNVKSKTYKSKASGATVYFAIGYMADKTLPHGHLVEDGTKPRYTQHATKYRKQAVRTIKVRGKMVTKYKKRSEGSFLKENADPSKVRYRGVMPAFRAVQKSQRTNKEVVERVIEAELRRKLAKYS